jgi:hypothetical protein
MPGRFDQQVLLTTLVVGTFLHRTHAEGIDFAEAPVWAVWKETAGMGFEVVIALLAKHGDLTDDKFRCWRPVEMLHDILHAGFDGTVEDVHFAEAFLAIFICITAEIDGPIWLEKNQPTPFCGLGLPHQPA